MNITALTTAYCPPILRPLFSRLKSSPVTYRLAKGVFWSIAGAAISRGLMLCAWIVVARLIGQIAFGELGMIRSTVGMCGVFAGFGLGLTATKHVAEYRQNDPLRAGRIIALSNKFAALSGGFIALCLLFLAPWLSEHTINAPQLAGVLRIGALILFINALNGAQTGALSGFEAFRTIAIINIIVGFASFPILIASTYLGGLIGAVWGLAINLGISWMANHLALRREARRHGVIIAGGSLKYDSSILWKFSLPAMLSSSLAALVNWTCYAFLVNSGDGYIEMSIIAATDTWFAMLLYFPDLSSKVFLPIASNSIGVNDKRQPLHTLKLSIRLNLILILPLVLIGCVASPYIMGLYGNEFCNGWPTLVVVFLTAGLVAGFMPIGPLVTATGKMWVRLSMNISWAVPFLGFTLLFLDKGALGLSLAKAIGYLVQSTWLYGFAGRFFRASSD